MVLQCMVCRALSPSSTSAIDSLAVGKLWQVTQDYTMDMRSDDSDTLLTTVTYEAPRHQPHLLQTNLVRTSTGISLSLYEIAASRSNRQLHPEQ